ncbi:hypothetical protein W97_06539 [Coniosporium apollinis CBS 100218]|uniref:Glycosyl hydrolase n=1 Tax=Coniosporium apollinis (strain CBS 100218) TaxID=1168221 RepID=R7Z042_CONA1|nr:uncharacterized protein W97_06539 [Coniosporium apollinis CBS 100218]EON67286.1 hypothetical protein W97_06539 [Coniosporium apollinis CBS 100218]
MALYLDLFKGCARRSVWHWIILALHLLAITHSVIAKEVGEGAAVSGEGPHAHFEISPAYIQSFGESKLHGQGLHNDRNKRHDYHAEPSMLPPGAKEMPSEPPSNALPELHGALETMQTHFFELWLGTWPDSIDWTSAVLGTYVSASVFSLTRSLEYVLPFTQATPASIEGQRIENEINKYFSHTVAYYFGQNAFSIRTQAYDDMLWVVLGWLENIRFMNLHTKLHYPSSGTSPRYDGWYGKQFEAAFAHRAHVFYDITTHGWDTKLCGGGMTWNPHLTPYKNAITNQLFISASIGMYLYFPGDDNSAPFVQDDAYAQNIPSARPHDPKYLWAAVEGYEWLSTSNMTNKKGLYVDGFHISGWNRNGSIGTGKCDDRNEMVYTYNQGVLLSGLRGLWEGTGQLRYLEDGHTLIRNVMAATGWPDEGVPHDRRWAGLGRYGILEEVCDSSGSCSQNGQTFKGIFFHHLTLFCEPLPRTPLIPGKTFWASPAESMLHAQSCKEYAPWVTHNARAALNTRNEKGEFGMWWGGRYEDDDCAEYGAPLPEGAVDYRNDVSVSGEKQWMVLEGLEVDDHHLRTPDRLPRPASRAHTGPARAIADSGSDAPGLINTAGDANDRGRGRTVETQGGGVAVLRAMWEFVNMYRQER